MKIPGLGVKLELQLQAYTKAMAMPDLRHICDLRCSLQQRWILKPLSEARDQTCILMDPSQVLNPRSHSRNSHGRFLDLVLQIVSFFSLII